jgi:transposase
MSSTSTTSTPYFCGIDVAKRQHVALLLDSAGQRVKPAFTVTNCHDGFTLLLQQLRALPGSATVAIEATGHYWLALYETLTSAGYPVVVLNPLQVHAYQRSGIRKCKNDRSDAFWIADFVRISHAQPASASLPTLLQLRELARFRYSLAAQIGDCKRKIVGILDRVFPEYEGLFSNVFIASSRRLLQEAVTAQEFADFDLSELSRLLHKVSRGRLGIDRAQALQQAAQQSVGVSFLSQAVHTEIGCLLQQFELLEAQCKELDAALEALMAQLPQYGHLTSIPGLGLVTGAMILAEVGDVSRFSSLEKLVAYAGIDASVYQSGEYEGQHRHMSKRGSPHLRHALWQAANVAIHHEPELQAFYERKRAEGKHHGTALGAVCRKLLARIYVVLKEQRPYIVH